MKPILIDTFFVVALINPRDAYHERALEASEKYQGASALVTDAILLEIGNALARGFKPESVEIIQSFLQSPEIEVVSLTPQLFASAFVLYKTYRDKEWGLVDCVSFCVMREREITAALTFDAHFSQAGFEALLRS